MWTGSAAAVIASEKKARELGLMGRAVKVSASALTSDPWQERDLVMPDVNTCTRKAAQTAFEMAGLGPQDVDLVELHDCFATAEILHYENLGLCGDGEAGRMIDEGETALGGRIPVNVSGGLLSKGHPLGATGIANIYEVSTHLRGEAGKRQVEGAKVGMTHVIGLGSACGIHSSRRWRPRPLRGSHLQRNFAPVARTAAQRALLCGLLLCAAGCSEERPAAAASSPAPEARESAKKDERRGRPLPSFEGASLSGDSLSLSAMLGRRLLLFGFNPELPEAALAAKALAAIAGERGDHNFEIVGFAMGTSAEAARAFLAEHGLEIESFHDEPGALMRQLGFRRPRYLLLVDADGNMLSGTDYFSEADADPAGEIETWARQSLRLPDPNLLEGEKPLAPLFSAPAAAQRRNFFRWQITGAKSRCC